MTTLIGSSADGDSRQAVAEEFGHVHNSRARDGAKNEQVEHLPTSLASYGPITLASMGLTTVGALALALLFAALSRRMPADGGSRNLEGS